jgi:hypothetical protein
MSIFDEFDKKVGADFQDKVKEATENQYEETPKGKYVAKIEKMELGMSKDKRPMFKVQMRLTEGVGNTEEKFLSKYKKKKPCVFMNRVVFGTKNDGAMIASVIGWLNKLIDKDDEPVVFTTYSDLADEILDLTEDFADAEIEINYDPDKFNSIEIVKVF